MSAFSDMLSNFIEQKNIKIFSLARFCELDRSTMYKIINGKRNAPSIEVLDKIAQYLILTPAEKIKLKEAWEITKIGPETYYKRKSVENFILNFPEHPNSDHPDCSFSLEPTYDHTSADCVSLRSQQHINRYVHQMILSEAARENGKTALFLQPDYKFLFSLLASLPSSCRLDISQIICISNEFIFTDDHQLVNLKNIREVFPLYMTGINYTLWYYYDRIQSHYHNFNIFPCMILTSDSALLCTSDYQNGLFFHSAETVNMLWNIYLSYQEQCSMFFNPAVITLENYAAILTNMYNPAFSAGTVIGIQPEICLTPFFTGKLLRDIFNHELPDAQNILAMAEQAFLINMDRLNSHQFFIYSTEEGLMQFARSGLTEEIPEIFYHPLTPEQRIEVLSKVRCHCLSGAYHILQKPLNHLPRNLHLCIRGTAASMIFQNNNSQPLVLDIKENRLINILRDYLENMEESRFYTIEESVELIDQTIKEIKQADTIK